MTWNIWHGGLHGPKSINFEQDTSYTENVLNVIQMEDPDLLLMQETYCCGMEIAKEAGFDYSWRSSSNLSIHSKYPIIDTLNIFKPFNSQGAIIDVNGQQFLFVNLWLHYLPDYFNDIKTMSVEDLIQNEYATRLSEIQNIIKEVNVLSDSLNIPIVIGGDFNSGSHLDWIESTKAMHYNKVIEWPVSKFMTKEGFKDSFREVHNDPTNSLEGTWGFLNDDIISDRIDYIYFRGEQLTPIESKIVLEDPPNGFFNSDHRAISTIFNF